MCNKSKATTEKFWRNIDDSEEKVNKCPTAPRKIQKAESRWIWSKKKDIILFFSVRQQCFVRDGGHFTEAENKNMTDGAAPSHGVPYLAEILLWRGMITLTTGRMWFLVSPHCNMTVSNLPINGTFSSPAGVYGSLALSQLFVTSGFWWHYSCLSSLKKGWSMLCHPACSSLNTLTE